MKKLLLLISVYLFCLGLSKSQPTNNPIAEFYNTDEGYPAWTDQIKWNNVITMQNKFDAVANFEEFKTKRDLLYSQGGGVLYYPAGVYTFDISDAPNSEGLMLKKGVVIRGEKPSSGLSAVLPGSDIKTLGVSDHGLKDMPTKFLFTTTDLGGQLTGQCGKMWNCIGIKVGAAETGLQDVEKVGVCWIEMEFGFIYFGFGTKNGYAPNYSTVGYNFIKPVEPWKSSRVPDGTHPLDWFGGNTSPLGGNSIQSGTKRFVFGVHIKHGGVPGYVAAHGLGSTFYSEDGPWSFGAKISVYGSHLFIANNVISKPTKSFLMVIQAGATKSGQCALAVGSPAQVPYDFGKGLSIDVNKNYMAWFKNNSAVDDSSSQYAPDVIIQDNFVYNHSSKGFEIGGGWMIVRNNINRREKYDHTDVYGLGLTTFYGVHASSGRIWPCQWNDDFMARAFTVSSRCAWYHKNQYINTGSAFDNSGEGILHQDHLNGSECYSAALTYNRGNSYMGVWNSLITGYFMGWNEVTTNIMVANPTGFGADISSVAHKNLNTGEEYFYSPTLGTLSNIKDYESFDCSSGGVTPGTPVVTVKDTADFVKITWTNVEDEAAYRVERKLKSASAWTTIAYRPRVKTGCVVSFNGDDPKVYWADGHGTDAWDQKIRDMNPTMWRDYMKSAGEYQYRVIAVGCEDMLSTAISNPVDVTVSPSYPDKLKENTMNANQLVLYPNPSSDYIYGNMPNSMITSVRMYSVLGKLEKSLDNVNSVQFVIPMKDIKNGHYIIEVKTKQGTIRKLVMKQ